MNVKKMFPKAQFKLKLKRKLIEKYFNAKFLLKKRGKNIQLLKNYVQNGFPKLNSA